MVTPPGKAFTGVVFVRFNILGFESVDADEGEKTSVSCESFAAATSAKSGSAGGLASSVTTVVVPVVRPPIPKRGPEPSVVVAADPLEFARRLPPPPLPLDLTGEDDEKAAVKELREALRVSAELNCPLKRYHCVCACSGASSGNSLALLGVPGLVDGLDFEGLKLLVDFAVAKLVPRKARGGGPAVFCMAVGVSLFFSDSRGSFRGS